MSTDLKRGVFFTALDWIAMIAVRNGTGDALVIVSSFLSSLGISKASKSSIPTDVALLVSSNSCACLDLSLISLVLSLG